MSYRLKGRDILDLWLDKEPDDATRETVLLWMFHFLNDPTAIESTPIPIPNGPMLHSTVVPRTAVDVTYALSTDAVILRRIETLA